MFGRISPKLDGSLSSRTNSKGAKVKYHHDDFILHENQLYAPSSPNNKNSSDKSNRNRNRNPPGPGSYTLPSPDWKRRIPGGAIKMKAREGPSDRDLLLSNGQHIRNILPAPDSFTKPPPRSISPVLLRTSERKKAYIERREKEALVLKEEGDDNHHYSNSSSKLRTRKMDIGVIQKEMLKYPDIGPGKYDITNVFPRSNGAYSRGIVFSSTPRITGGIDIVNNGIEKRRSASRSPSPNRQTEGSNKNHNNNNNNRTATSSRMTDDHYGEDRGSRSRSRSRSPKQHEQQNNGKTTNRRTDEEERNIYSLTSSSFAKKKTSLAQSSFGYSPRILDMNVVNPFLKGPELAPPVGSYEVTDLSPKGGRRNLSYNTPTTNTAKATSSSSKKNSPSNNISSSTLYRRDREINLERKTAAPGPGIYESGRSTDIWKPVI